MKNLSRNFLLTLAAVGALAFGVGVSGAVVAHVGGDHFDRHGGYEQSEGDDWGDRDDDGGSAAAIANPAGPVNPPANGLFSAAPAAQSN